MKRKLFCELSPTCYKISVEKEILLRNLKDFFRKDKIAKTKSNEPLPNTVKSHSSVLVRRLHGVDIRLQENKVTNIQLSSEHINGMIIKPGETFSFWKTSGSTGNPKGVPISYKNLDNFMKWISRIEPLNGYEDITVLNQALFSFDLSVADIYYSLFNGHTLASLEHQDLGSFSYVFDTFNQKKPNVMVVTPTFVRLCLTDKSFCQERFPFIRCIYFCGEVLEPTTVRKLFVRFPNLKILNAYGPTEATGAVSAVLITSKIAEESENLPVGSLGDFATEIEIIDGEIVLKGKSVFHGYLGGEVGGYFEENGIDCYCTGDNGKIENGMLYCLGRSDRQIKVNGYRVELDEIERHIDSVKGVTACGVVASYASNGKLRCINAFVCGEGINEQQIRNKLKSSLPPYMIPKNIKIVDKLAVNRNGKIDRRALIENEEC